MNDGRISRVKRSKAEARASYNRIAPIYDFAEGRFEKGYREAGLEQLAPSPGEKILEIGYGTGHTIVELARAVGSGTVYGLDISGGMRRIALARVRRAGLADRVDLDVGDACHLPFLDNSFDAVYMSFTLELFDTPEIPIVLRECRRVLRDGGRLCDVSMAKNGRPTRMLRLYEWAHAHFEQIADCRPIYVKKSMVEAGFRDLRARNLSMWHLPVEVVLGFNPPPGRGYRATFH